MEDEETAQNENGNQYSLESKCEPDLMADEETAHFPIIEKNENGNQYSIESQKCTQVQKKKRKRPMDLNYVIDENPPWYLCIILALQHFLTMVGGLLSMPFILSGPMCFKGDHLVMSEVLSTLFFVSGLATLLQTTFGVRLPIVQGSTFAFVVPTFAILALPQWKCPDSSAVPTGANGTISEGNTTLPNGDWKLRMREIQGAIIVSSLFQIVIGFSGLIGFLLRFIGPLTITPTITLVGLALFPVAASHSGNHWGISIMTMSLIALFAEAMKNVKIPVRQGHFPLFRLFPVILGIIVSWIVCAIVTAAGGFPDDPNSPQYMARTDARTEVLFESNWFRFPYPGQWGTPTVSFAGVFGMLAGVVASIIESIGDYHACARMCGAPALPKEAVNRGIGMEGIGCMLAGAWGSGNGTTSFSENIGALSITKVGSLFVIQVGGVLLLVLGIMGKLGAMFITIPDPIVGGVLMVMFGMIVAVGISNLQFVQLNNSRNLFIVGFSLLFGMALPFWMKLNPDAINTGVKEIDQIITVFFSTSMAVGGITGCVLDNALPGTPEERGLIAWKSQNMDSGEESFETASIHVYDLPWCLGRMSRHRVAKYLPFVAYHPNSDSDKP